MMLAYDISKLPKVRTHTQLGHLGWTWDEVQAAEGELVNYRQWLLDFANAIAILRDDAVSGGAPQAMIDGFNQSLAEQKALVQQSNQLMNEFYAKTGASVGSLGQLGNPQFRYAIGLKGLGQWQVALLEIAPLLGILAKQLYWVYVTYILGNAVEGYKKNAEAAQATAVTRADCYKLYREALANGQTPPSCVDTGGGSQDWTTIALIGGSVILAVMLLSRK